MKVYVDEMPKTCESCTYDDAIDCCELIGIGYFEIKDGFKHPNCPLQSIQDHDKEICDEIRDKLNDEIEIMGYYHDDENDTETGLIKITDVEEILDQIEKGEKDW